MLIEPAILLLFNSMRAGAGQASGVANTSTSLTTMLFDFLCRIATNYHLPYRESVLNGIMQSFKDSVDKKVIPSLQVFFVSQLDPKTQLQLPPGIDRDLRNLTQATFGNFFQTLNLNQTPQLAPAPMTATNPQSSSPLQPIKSLTSDSPTNIFTANSNATVPALSSPVSSTGTIPSPTPSPLVNIGSSSSLFKQKVASEGNEDTSSQQQSIKMEVNESIKFESPVSIYNEPIIMKTEQSDAGMSSLTAQSSTAPPIIRVTSSFKTEAFSSDEEDDVIETTPPVTSTTTVPPPNTLPTSISANLIKPRPNTPAPAPTPSNLFPNPSPNSLISSIQLQLQQFATKPFKVFTTLDDVQTIGATTLLASTNGSNSQSVLNSQTNLHFDNLLNLIGKFLKSY